MADVDLRILVTHHLDNLDAAVEQCLGPQCETVSAAGVRCVLNLDHTEICDVRPHPRLRRG